MAKDMTNPPNCICSIPMLPCASLGSCGAGNVLLAQNDLTRCSGCIPHNCPGYADIMEVDMQTNTQLLRSSRLKCPPSQQRPPSVAPAFQPLPILQKVQEKQRHISGIWESSTCSLHPGGTALPLGSLKSNVATNDLPHCYAHWLT